MNVNKRRLIEIIKKESLMYGNFILVNGKKVNIILILNIGET